MQDISIRLADWETQRDVNSFCELIDIYSRDPYGSGKPMPPEILEVLPQRWQQHPGAFTLIAWTQGNGSEISAVGMANCLTSFSTFKARPRINIHDLIVHPNYRGLGLGRKLITAVFEESLRRHACQVTLEVRADNEHARSLYERCGFDGLEHPLVAGTHFFGVKQLD